MSRAKEGGDSMAVSQKERGAREQFSCLVDRCIPQEVSLLKSPSFTSLCLSL